MRHFLLASTNNADEKNFNSMEALSEACEEFFVVTLSNNKELELLFDLLGIDNSQEKFLLNSEDFISVIDISKSKLPELDLTEFDKLYDTWLKISGRESTMDEYGQLVFLQSQAKEWNQMTYKFVLSEKQKTEK
ncbi:hypothetical protein H8K52_03215 [Undibacterium seohonense]|jgi:hypothetical protein|uniref:Uncharacterized protein n=1 Tax=Undibacterium seohonense TaxID=1344950 RepID=A0ABR6X1U5_9BURK|nr:hypothetical protein [Undibacterium seohonense]MBC3806356.1 hypothetical protein [Undibacterium seohonense]